MVVTEITQPMESSMNEVLNVTGSVSFFKNRRGTCSCDINYRRGACSCDINYLGASQYAFKKFQGHAKN
jgi:hypothetical protein